MTSVTAKECKEDTANKEAKKGGYKMNNSSIVININHRHLSNECSS